jgi:hypothetical protein
MRRRILLGTLAAGLVLAGAASVAATSFGAVLVYEDGVGLTYRAAPGEINRLTMNPFAGPIEGVSAQSMTIQDDNAPLRQLNDYCLPGPPLQCPTTKMFAYMGGGDDQGDAAPYFRDAYIWGQSGNDDIGASGRDHAVAYGGSGNDTLSVGADVDAEAWGQSGNDVISAGTQTSVHLYGGDGDDAISTATATFGSSVIDGGPGRDRIDVSPPGCCLDVLGQDGSDTITVTVARSIDGGGGNDAISGRATSGIDGGTGNDTITAHGSVRGSWGNDRINVSGNPDESDSVSCGPGRDAVTADPSDTIAADCEAVTR